MNVCQIEKVGPTTLGEIVELARHDMSPQNVSELLAAEFIVYGWQILNPGKFTTF
jgi:hypothetical protein